jgi:thioredoxin reductase
MAIDTPAKIAVLGAGPIGLEAALYARFLGYEVVIFEQGDVADSVRRWGHVRMFTPFGMNRSPLGLAAIKAQDEAYQPPADDELLSGRQLAERYLLPLSQTDLLADHLRTSTAVLAVGKEELLKGDMPGHEDRGDWSFRILVRDRDGREHVELADAVLDCTGVFGQANWLGHGGIPAVGEGALAAQIEHRLPEIQGSDRQRYAGRHTLLVGGGYSAATNVVALAELARDAPGTRVTWITRRVGRVGAEGPIEIIANDRLASRAEIAREANRLATRPESAVTYWPATVVERIERSSAESSWDVQLAGQHAGTYKFEQIIANVGFHPDNRLYRELQIHECYASEGPMKLAAALAGESAIDCLDQQARGPQTLRNPEPNYYILGAKSYGRNSNFLLSVGLEQIREAFTIIGDRETLDLYASAKNLPR